MLLFSEKKFHISFNFAFILMMIFSITRVYRNSFNHSSVQVGGIWNVISLMFLFISTVIVIGFIGDGEETLSLKIAQFYTFLAIFNAFLTNRLYSISSLYNILMIGFFYYIINIFFIVGKLDIRKKNKNIAFLLSFILFALTFQALLYYKIGKVEFVMVSIAYFSLCILPLLLFIFKGTFSQIFLYFMVGLIIIFSNKRAGLLAFAGFIFVVILGNLIQQKNIKGILLFFLFSFIGLFLFLFLYKYLQNFFNLTIIERLFNIFNDGGSGRDVIYGQLLDAMKSSSIMEWIFGHGCNTTGEVLIVHDTAHNDFLEILYDYGIIPLLLFIFFYVSLFIEGIKMNKDNYNGFGLFIGTLLISFFLSMFSTYCVSFGYVICGMASLGYILGDWRKMDNRRKL